MNYYQNQVNNNLEAKGSKRATAFTHFVGSIGQIVATILLVLGGFLTLASLLSMFEQEDAVEHVSKISQPKIQRVENKMTPETLALINDHLHTVHTADEIKRQFVALENSLRARALSSSEVGPEGYAQANNNHTGLSLAQENHFTQVERDLANKKDIDYSPSRKIESRVAKQEWAEDYNRKYEQQFIQAFIENARKQGFQVKFNENWEIVHVRKIRKRQPILF